MNLILSIWRQKKPTDKGKFVEYEVKDINPDMSFLEMLDVLNEKLIEMNVTCPAGICEAKVLYPQRALVEAWADFLEDFARRPRRDRA